MNSLDRRRFLSISVATATTATLATRVFAQSAPARADGRPVTLTLHPEKPGPTIPANFIGLSYETQQLTNPDFFSPANTGLVAQFRALSPRGVLRLGGNTSDVGWWKPTPTSTQPPLPPKVVVTPLRPDEQPFQKLAYSVTPQAVTNLRAFLDATGWTCLYGINLGTSTPERAAAEADFAARTLGWAHGGGKLEYFQLGNEPDLFPARFRVKATWSADAYFDEWLAAVNAIRARVPQARFGLPDTSGNPEWYAQVVDRLLKLPQATTPGCFGSGTSDPGASASSSCAGTRPAIAALSHHYYFGGPPSNPDVNISALLQHSSRVDTLAHDITDAAARLSGGSQAPVPFRMSEGNTCYRGGKPGVSDVFAASLWAADYALTLAQFGYAGLNLHGGSGKAVADSLGGTLPGELLMPDPNALHPRPFYTPIAQIDGQPNGRYVAEPTFYGLLFAGQFAGGTMIPLDFNAGPGGFQANATAYAAKLPTGQVIIAIINKDATQPLHIDVPGYSLARTLTASSPDSTGDSRMASRTVHYDEPATFREVSIVPPASAVLLQSARA